MDPDAPQPIRLVPVAKPAGATESKPKLTFVLPPEPPVPPAPMEPGEAPIGEKLPHHKNNVLDAPLGQPSSDQPFPKPPQKKSGKTWLWILLAFLLAAAGGAGWWFLAGPNGHQETAGENGRGTTDGVSNPKEKAIRTSYVNPLLTLQLGKTHCQQFGGHVAPDAYSFRETREGLPSKMDGNPIYFLSNIASTWLHFECGSGGGHIFERDDRYVCKEDPQYASLRKYIVDMMLTYSIMFTGQTRQHNLQQNAQAMRTLVSIVLNRGACFPAPVVLSDKIDDERFLYLNEQGNPSTMRWGVETNAWFWCCEGQDALAGYAQTLRELREVLVNYTAIAKEEGLRTYSKAVTPKIPPTIYIAELDEGTRQKATVAYEFVVNNNQYRIKETSQCRSGTYTRSWSLDLLDAEVEFCSRFETEESTERAFEPLYCFLSQKKILHEEARLEAKRINERMEGKDGKNDANGKKKQKLNFSSIGKQTINSNVELEATAESGGKIVFSVESGPGKIEGNTLTFTGTGIVELQARQWGNDQWYSATATQSVEVVQAPATQHVEGKSTGGISPSEPRQNARDSTSVPKTTGQEQKGDHLLPEFAPLAEALETAKRSPTGTNYKALMTAWEALPKQQKDATQKPVLWAFYAMLCAKGQADEVLKHQSMIDYPAFRDTVSDPCKTCKGTGRKRIKCATCGGTGAHEVKCNICKGTGICSFCRGTGLPTSSMSGRALKCSNCRGTGKCKACSRGVAKKACADCKDGIRSLRCPTCNGSGRIYPADKCERVAQENIEEALGICQGERPASTGDDTAYDSDDWGFGNGWH